MHKIISLLFALILFIPALSRAQENHEGHIHEASAGPLTEIIEGKHYQVLPYPVRPRDPKKIEVVELFWYGCPHCYSFEPLVKPWAKQLPADVDFWQSPATFNEIWETHAYTYYALDALNALDKAHQPLFDALARDKRPLNSKDALADFLATLGIDAAAFKRAYDSFGVRAKVEQASARLRSYRATGVPALIVNGKYRIDAGSAGSMQNMLKVAEFLIAKERGRSGS